MTLYEELKEIGCPELLPYIFEELKSAAPIIVQAHITDDKAIFHRHVGELVKKRMDVMGIPISEEVLIETARKFGEYSEWEFDTYRKNRTVLIKPPGSNNRFGIGR